jgi:DNA-binding NarL/FixJ family response regulator
MTLNAWAAMPIDTTSSATSRTARDTGPAATPAGRVLIIDGDTRSASHFNETLDRMGFEAFTARSIAEGVALAAQRPPQLLVLTLPERDTEAALNLAGELTLRHGTRCIFVLDRADPAALHEVTAAGAHGVLCKPVHREQLEATFRLAMEQHGSRRAPRPAEDARVRLLEGALHRIAQELARLNLSTGQETGAALPICGLRPREQEVVRLLLQHLRVPAIARRLGISQQTVRNHLKSVFRRTGVRSQQELLDRIALASVSQPSPEADAAASAAGDFGDDVGSK